MKKCIVFFSILILLFPIVTEAKEYQKNLNFGDVVISVGYDNGKIVYNGQLKYAFTGADRVGAYVNYIDGYSWYCTGVYSSSGGSAHLFADVKATMNGEEVQPSYAPAFNDKTYDVSGVQYVDSGFISEYKVNNASVGILGCPIFSSFEALDKYLSQGIYDESDLISPDGIDSNGNPIYPEKYDKTIPVPQNFHWFDMTPKNGVGGFLVGNTSYFTWQDPDKVNIVSGKFNAEIQVKATIDYKNAFGGKVCRLTNDDWITISKSDLDTTSHILYWLLDNGDGMYSPCANLSEMQLALNLASSNGYEQGGDIGTVFEKDKFYKYDFYSFKYRIRNYYINDGNKICSAWVEKSVNDVTSIFNNDDGNNSADIKDPDGNDVSDYVDYSQDSASSTSSNNKETIFDWLARQVNGLENFFASVKKSFSTATDAGTSFIAMFKSYNSWLPESFFTILVTGIGIVIFLRILGR